VREFSTRIFCYSGNKSGRLQLLIGKHFTYLIRTVLYASDVVSVVHKCVVTANGVNPHGKSANQEKIEPNQLFHDGWHKLKIVHDGHKSIVSCIIFCIMPETNIANPPKPISPVIALQVFL
jgi:hypothetical protein